MAFLRSERPQSLSLAGIFLFTLVIVLLAPTIADTIKTLTKVILESTNEVANTAYTWTNETVTPTTTVVQVGNETATIPLPLDDTLSSIAKSLFWVLEGVLRLLTDPFLLSLVIILTLIVYIVSRRG